ncbi:ragulator complex protein LAMTOR4 homolog [Artemia franciscana]|uniref:ragulator complex protein LAMTOR4 homolog n=1 Tax=Artemia franciscana TaxID=6661 RepID=UPI0032DBE565
MPAIVTKGSLVLTSDGAIISSSGSFSNDERTAKIFFSLIQTALSLDVDENLKELSISYGDHRYTACTSNKKIHIARIQSDQ